MYSAADKMMDIIHRERLHDKMNSASTMGRSRERVDNYVPTYHNDPIDGRNMGENSFHFQKDNDYNFTDYQEPSYSRRSNAMEMGFSGDRESSRREKVERISEYETLSRLKNIEDKVNYLLVIFFIIVILHIIMTVVYVVRVAVEIGSKRRT